MIKISYFHLSLVKYEPKELDFLGVNRPKSIHVFFLSILLMLDKGITRIFFKKYINGILLTKRDNNNKKSTELYLGFDKVEK